MKKLFRFIIIFVSITIVPGICQTGAGGFKGVSLIDSSQIYVQKIINSKMPVLADFWAKWCGPCKILEPIISQIKKEYKGKIKVIKIDVDKNRQLSGYFRVVAIPSVFIIKDKIVVKRIPGVQPKEVYIAAINEVIEPEKTKSGQ